MLNPSTAPHNRQTMEALDYPEQPWQLVTPSNLDPRYYMRMVCADDDEQLQTLASVPIASRGVLLSFRRAPSYFAAQNLMFSKYQSVGIFDAISHCLVGTFTNGWRPCWVNGRIVNMRYTCDLRILQRARGQLMLAIFAAYKQQMQGGVANFSQTILMEDNLAALKALTTKSPDLLSFYPDAKIKTLTVTAIRSAALVRDAEVIETTATEADILAMNEFVARMGARYYRGLPVYDFSQLGSDNPYYKGLVISDFVVLKKAELIIGLVGVWHQKAIKQTVIQGYPKWMGLLRPIYNIGATLVGGMRLPHKGAPLSYAVLHSLLCHPGDLATHDRLIRAAWAEVKRRNIDYMSYTLAESDPRFALNPSYQGETIHSVLGYFCYNGNPNSRIDKSYVAYAECGRI